FAQLTDLTEFVTAATVPNGAYVAAKLTLDYSNADIVLEGSDGNPVSADPYDSDGNPLDGTIDLEVRLDNRNHLVIAPGVPALLTLDFNLDATHEVDLSTSPARVTVEPVLVAEANPDETKPHRIRGTLVSVDEEAMSFRIAVRPSRHKYSRDLGTLTVYTGDETVFEVNGTTATGADGFGLLAASQPGTAVVAKGNVDLTAKTFRATEVYAGTSVPGGDRDGLVGVVVGRDAEGLTVRGGTLDRSLGALYLNQDVTVTWTDETTVTRELDPNGAYTVDDVSVGQRVAVLGTYSEDGGTPVFQATHIRMLVTRIAGEVVGKDEGELRLDLEHIEGRSPDRFDFSGTGATAGDDADPNDYQVNTGGLALPDLDVGAPVRVFGFVTPFGAAPPDFDALTVADYSNATARLRVQWERTSEAELTADADGLTLDLTDAGRLHHVFRGGIATELEPEPAPTVIPENPDRGVFAVHQRGGPTRVYHDYASFADYLAGQMEAGRHVAFVSGLGSFDVEGQVFTARKIFVRLR
ncbi:MAG: metallophosphoesterase, partial [Candidatus Dadabacteria bacterium]